jgi:hypothetical protein
MEYIAARGIRLSDNLLLSVIDAKPRVTNMSSTFEIAHSFSERSTVTMINRRFIKMESIK